MTDETSRIEALSTLDSAAKTQRLKQQPAVSQPNNALAWIHPDVLHFSPGERTRDDSSLGDLSGRITVAHDLAISTDITWTLLRNGTPVQQTTTNSGQVTILSGAPGVYDLSASRQGTEVGAAKLWVPQFVQVHASAKSLAASLEACGIPASARDDVTERIITSAARVAHHILRPANVRLIWPFDSLPPHYRVDFTTPQDTLLATPEQQWLDTHTGTRGLAAISIEAPAPDPNDPVAVWNGITEALHRLFPGLADSDEKALYASIAASAFSQDSATEALRNQFKALENNESWAFDARLSGLGCGVVRAGLGHLAFDGTSLTGTEGSSADTRLRALSAAVPSASWGTGGTDEQVFTEVAGRWIGVAVARAVLRLVGVDEQQAHASHFESAPRQAEPISSPVDPTNSSAPVTVAAGIMASEPDMPERDFLGMKEGRDLVAAANADTASFRQARNLHGPGSGYDALCGLITDATLDQMETTLGPLPPSYGPYDFKIGDNDTTLPKIVRQAPVYEGKPRIGAAAPPRNDMIELAQKDLAAVGILAGLADTNRDLDTASARADKLHDVGRYGFHRAISSAQRYDGHVAKSPASESRDNTWTRAKGHTGYAVREFQIAARYPNVVCEDLSDTNAYALRLYPVGATRAPAADSIAASGVPSPDVHGTLDVVTAYDLRRWRFQRRRFPVIIAAGSQDDSKPFDAQGTVPAVHNVAQPGHVQNKSLRMRVFDYSGYHDPPNPHAPFKIGKLGGDRYRGQHLRFADRDTNRDMTLAGILGPTNEWEIKDTTGPNETVRRERLHSVYRVMRGVSRVESYANFSSSNSWDSAVYSYPPFHFTLLTTKGTVSIMGGVLDWLKNPEDELLKAVYPDASNMAAAPALPGGYPTTQEGVDQLRRNLKQRMQSCYAMIAGNFGVGAGEPQNKVGESFITIKGQETVESPPGQTPAVKIDLTSKWTTDVSGLNATKSKAYKFALYQGYADWFRGWHWTYRFDAPLRASQDLRTLLFAYSVEWVETRLKGSFASVRSEAGRAAVLRMIVKGAYQLKKEGDTKKTTVFSASTIKKAITGTPKEEHKQIKAEMTRALKQARTIKNNASLKESKTPIGSTRTAMNHKPPDTEIPDRSDFQDPEVNGKREDFYLEVRNYILRTLMHGQVND